MTWLRKNMAAIIGLLMLVLAMVVIDPVSWIKAKLTGYVEASVRSELREKTDALQVKVDSARHALDSARHSMDSVAARAEAKDEELGRALGELGALRGRIGTLERLQAETGGKGSISDSDIGNVSVFVDSIIGYRDSVLRAIPR